MKKVLFIVLVSFILFFTGCILNEKNAQEIILFTDISASIGAFDNQTLFQELKWRVNVTNTAGRTAGNVRADIVLHPALSSRLEGSYIDRVRLGDLQPGTSSGFDGAAIFNATGLSKQDIAGLRPLLSIKLKWMDDGNEKEQIVEAS